MRLSLRFFCALGLAAIACSSAALPGMEDAIEPTATVALPPTEAPPPTAAPTVPPATPTEPGPEEIRWQDARAHVGQTAQVCGKAAAVVRLLDGRTIVSLGNTLDRGGVAIVVEEAASAEAELEGLAGATVCVTGLIDHETDLIVMVVAKASQLEAERSAATPSGPTGLLFREDYMLGLQVGWEWQNENPSRWEITPDGWLQIFGEDESLLAGGAQSNLLCRDAPEGDFQVTARLYADPRNSFQQATLYLYQDGDNFAAVNRGFCGPCGGGGIYVEHKSAGNLETANAMTSEVFVFLRLIRQGGSITGAYAFETGEWQSFTAVEDRLENPKVCIGVSNVDSAGIDADLVAEFDYVEIARP